MADDDTLDRLVTFTRRHRYTATRRELVCSTCASPVILDAGMLWCQGGKHVFERFAELAVRE